MPADERVTTWANMAGPKAGARRAGMQVRRDAPGDPARPVIPFVPLPADLAAKRVTHAAPE